MVNIHKKLISRLEQNEDAIGAVLLLNNERFPFHANEYDYFLLVFLSKQQVGKEISHLEIEGQRVFVRTISSKLIEQSNAVVRHYNLMDWLVSGEIVYDVNGKIEQLRKTIDEFPGSYRDYRILCEFNGFIEMLYLAKKNLYEKNILDAYSQILQAVHYWAHIVLIEDGIHPELTVWKQLRKVHPGVYKLYEELIASPETVEQRVELVMLACEFTVMNKMKECCKFLIDKMNTGDGAWSIAQLKADGELQHVSDDLTLILRKLVQGHLLKEVVELVDIEQNVFEIKYELIK